MPLLEAMVFGLPVIAYDAGAVAETLRGGGHPPATRRTRSTVAALVDRVLDATTRCARPVLAHAGARAGGAARGRLRRAAARAPGARAGLRVRIDQWVPALHRGDAIGDSARLMRDAFRPLGARGRRLRARAGRGPRGRRPARGPAWRAGAAGRRRHPALRAAVAADRRPRRPPRPPRAPPPQHHARPSSSPAGTPEMVRICALGRARAGRPARTSCTSASATASTTARSWRRRASRRTGRAAHLPRLRALPRAAGPGAAADPRRRAHQPAVRRPPRAQQAARRPHPPGRLLEALHLAGRAAGAGGQAAAAARLRGRAAVADVRARVHGRGGAVHRPRQPPRAAGLLRGRRTCSCP